MTLLHKVRGRESWVIYQVVTKGVVTGVNGVCEQTDWEQMERIKPGGTVVIQAGIADEAVAERLARGTSGDTKPRLTRETVT